MRWRQPVGWSGGRVRRGFRERTKPIVGSLLGRHGPQPRIASKRARNVFQFEDVDRVPALPQSMRAGGDPEGGRDVFHERILLYICTVISSRMSQCLRPTIWLPPRITH